MMLNKTLLAAAFGGLLISQTFACLGQDPDAPLGTNIVQPPRWPVMTGSDRGALQVSPKPVPTTLGKLGSLPRPKELESRFLARYSAIRLGLGEKTLWSVNASLVGTKYDRDGDYHLILRSASGQQIACELPDPKRMTSPSVFARQMTQSRAALLAKLHPTDIQQSCNVPIHLTGLGYFGRVKPGSGLKNGLQLHPVISIVFPK